jgi:hypothetical protein
MTFIVELASKSPAIEKGLESGDLMRTGSLVKDRQTGKIVQHLVEINPSTTSTNSSVSDLSTNSLNFSTLSNAGNLLTLGMNVIGFVSMGSKLRQITDSIDDLKRCVKKGLKEINKSLEEISQKLGYMINLLYIQDVKQNKILEELKTLQNLMIDENIAELQAHLDEFERFSNKPHQEMIRVASKAKFLFMNVLQKAKVENDYESMIHTDMIFQLVVLTSSIEIDFLLKLGKYTEANLVIDRVDGILKNMIQDWIDLIIYDEHLPKHLRTIYRFESPLFEKNISKAFFQTLLMRLDQENNLNEGEIFTKEIKVDVELIKNAKKYNDDWNKEQTFKLNFLEGLIELSDRFSSRKDLIQRFNEIGFEQTQLFLNHVEQVSKEHPNEKRLLIQI